MTMKQQSLLPLNEYRPSSLHLQQTPNGRAEYTILGLLDARLKSIDTSLAKVAEAVARSAPVPTVTTSSYSLPMEQVNKLLQKRLEAVTQLQAIVSCNGNLPAKD